MKIIPSAGVAAMLATNAMAFSLDMNKLVQLQAMQNRFDDDQLDKDQQTALMKNVANYSDMDLFMSKQITASEYKQSMVQSMKDKMIADILNGGGIDITNPLWRRTFFADKDDAELFSESLPEPMRSVIRLAQDKSDPTIKAYGKELLKKLQYKKFNSQGGSYLSQNIDEILLSDDKSATIKAILKQQYLDSIADPIDRAMMYNFQQQKEETDSVKIAALKANIKDLQKIKIFQGSVPDVSPVSADNLYSFYQVTNNGQIKGADILNVALGESLGPISDLDFERYFGSPAKQFSCRAHTEQIRVPCGVMASASECTASGCCYLPNDNPSVPNCFRDLYGKIGSAILRKAYVTDDKEDHIASLFDDNRIPTLDSILRFDTPYGVTLNNGDLNAVQYSSTSWWEAAKVKGQPTKTGNGDEAYLIHNTEERPVYGNPNRPKWTPHGPTVSPYFANMPAGAHPTAAPESGFGDLDNYYKMWLSYAAAQEEAQCALINLTKRIKCMDNFEALKDKATGATRCQNAGCCFNEDSFLEGGDACYRARDYGTCTALPTDYQKRNCGYEGITEKECLTNTRCCYDPSINNADPWCYYKYSATLEEDEWCSAWNLVEHKLKRRTECFGTDQKDNFLTTRNDNPLGNLNNLVSKEQCEAAGCCFDESLNMNTLEWVTNGLGLNDQKNMYRCFYKENPVMAAHFNTGTTLIENVAINHNQDGDGVDLDSPHDFDFETRTCDTTQWYEGLHFKRSCGEGLSYYQCVYVNKCCFKQNFNNEPVCYFPEIKQ